MVDTVFNGTWRPNYLPPCQPRSSLAAEAYLRHHRTRLPLTQKRREEAIDERQQMQGQRRFRSPLDADVSFSGSYCFSMQSLSQPHLSSPIARLEMPESIGRHCENDPGVTRLSHYTHSSSVFFWWLRETNGRNRPPLGELARHCSKP